MTLLQVEDLTVTFPTPTGPLYAVRGVSFTAEPGRTLAVVGESGSGKSVTAQTIMGLTRGAQISGSVLFEGRDLLGMTSKQMRAIRGAQISIVFQDPLTSLHPSYTVGWQIVEMIRAHETVTKRQARSRAVELLGLVGIPRPDERLDEYPHQFSGGMRQRAMIAMALALEPKVLIADEPTTALDVTVQAQILRLLQRLQRELGTAIIMSTHDLGVVADIADDVVVMYAGTIVEMLDRRTAYRSPHHPYTHGLLGSQPGFDSGKDRLTPIWGEPPNLIHPPSGCPFHPRCPFVMERCTTNQPPLVEIASESHRSACWLPMELIGMDMAVDERRRAVADRERPSGYLASPGAQEDRSSRHTHALMGENVMEVRS